MIVKDESHIIEKTLNNLCNYFNFSYYLICDTGSKDNTIELIKNFFQTKNISGEVLEHEWKNFEYNRNLALKYAKDKAEYSLIFDADDFIHSEMNINKLDIPNILDADGYSFIFKGGGSSYNRVLLINNNSHWKWVGVVHEVLTCKKAVQNIKHIKGNYYIDSGRIGSRNKDPLKYKKDALLLEDAIKDPNTDKSLISRYAFYCGQSWKDFNDYDKSIYWYKKVVNEYNNWNEEKYYACLKIGEIFEFLNNKEQALYWYLLTSNFNNKRLEGITNAGRILVENKLYNYAEKCLYESWKFSNLMYPSKDFLFATDNIYLYEYLSLITRASYYSKNYSLCKTSFIKLINRYKELKCDNLILELINLQFYVKIFNTKEKYALFENILGSIKRIINEKDCQTSQKIIKNCDNYFTDLANSYISTYLLENEENTYNLKKKLISNKNKIDYNIILTMTTCKRIDLFKKTMDSILINWEDIDLIDKFIIIDDNSSEEDKKNMLEEYPFIELFEKNEKQKGHRSSMNIIYDLLNKFKPKYWIHLEDDWLFFKKDNYVKKGIKSLKLLEKKGIHQILYNKGYGEIISDLCVPIGEKVSELENVLLHIQNQKIPMSSCSYWWHYSFRPSIIHAEKILELGNYDSENTFFELDYAKKYVNAGYKSAYFDDITCLHIGRLSGIRANRDINNAYNLNNIDQFSNTIIDNKVSNNFIKNKEYLQEKINISDILSNNEIKYIDFNEEFIFVKGYDIIGNDLFYNNNRNNNTLINISLTNENCIGFNTLGFFKNKIGNLQKSQYFNENDGIYIKKKYLNFNN
jgi:sporulation protein YlmC with PRC-barrel domain